MSRYLIFFSIEKKQKSGAPDSIDCTPPDYIVPGSTYCPLLPLHPGSTTKEVFINVLMA